MGTTADPWQACAVAADVQWAAHGAVAGIETRVRQRLAALMSAAKRSPLYRERFARHSDAFADQPPITKAELMARFDDWVCDRRLTLAGVRTFVADPARIGTPCEREYTVWESSGSSGVPGLFVQDAHAMAVYDALEALRRPGAWSAWTDPFGWSRRIAFVGATGGHFASTVTVERLRRTLPMMATRLQGFSFLQPTAALTAALDRWRPDIVATYPTAALLLAEEQAAGRLHLALREVWTGGEALGAGLRHAIAGRFGCPVRASYGASEFLALAAECAERKLHLNSDWAILEAVDARGRPVSPGTTGSRTLLTNLANRVQPLIRYELGDRVRFAAQRCACGSPLPVIEVEGRVDDALLLRGTDGRSVRLLPLALTTVLEDEAGVFDFQIVQHGPRTLQLSVGGGDPTALERARTTLATYLRDQGLAGTRLQVRGGPAAVRGRSGKQPRVVRGDGRRTESKASEFAQDHRGAARKPR